MNPLTNLQDLQELESRLLRGTKTVKPHATPCLEGTRTAILADVDIKTKDCNVANIIHIYGAPGSGKSSISLTAKSRLYRERRIVTYFRFDRNEAATTTPTALWCRVAYDLAYFFPSVLSQFLQQLRNNEVDLDSPMDIFTSFIEDPLLNITSPVDRPLVVIIDALDECGGLAGRLSPDRQMLLRTLRRWPKLPKHFKLLVTSRPEGDIFRVLSSISTPIEIPSGRSITENPQLEGAINSSNDIRMFLEDRFLEIRERLPSLPADWPGSETIRDMVHRAAGIFMWATTATNFIDEGIDPNSRLQSIMDNASNSSGMKPLYSLYSIVLEIAFGKIGSDGEEAETLQCILGTMILVKRPFVDVECTKLPTTKPVTQTMLDSIRDGLRSVIAPGSLRFVHKSFDDFLLSEECPPKYAIRKDQCHYLLAKLCKKTMSKGLRFNICDLETSCLMNTDVPNIETKVVKGISPLLAYSCLFFADHLFLTPFDEYLMREVQEMMTDRLLFWFEAMSLLKEINRVPPSLLLILKWLHISPIEEFKDLLHDARRFVGVFGHLIAESAPHLYISALPFAPENSSVAQHFLPRFPWTLSLSIGKRANWPSCIFTSEHHQKCVYSVAFSADEKYFVSGSEDQTICVFDSETGNLVSGPFECDDLVHSVCFDPTGRRVGAGCADGSVICWDLETGDKHLAIHTPHNYKFHNSISCHFGGSRTIISAGRTIALWNGETGRCEQECGWGGEADERVTLTSISPDGCYIAGVTGRLLGTIEVWKVVSGSKIQGPVDSYSRFEHPRRITALSFLVDSNFVASGLTTGIILIWDICTGENVGSPFSTGDGVVIAIAFSPKNYLVASTFNMVTVWNVTTHELLGQLEGHVTPVMDIALSRDGQRVLTASTDGTVRMWGLGRKGVVLGTNANRTHTSQVWDVAFSRCGKKLASLDGHSIQGWDKDTGKSLAKIDTGTEHRKLIFSPDGRQVVAYEGERGSIEVWNVTTWALVSHIELNDHDEEPTRIDHAAFRSTDGVLVLCSNNGVVRIWSIENGVPQIIAKLPKIVALSPDGLTAIVRDDQRSPRHYVWSTTTHQPLPIVLDDDEYVSGSNVAYSPSGRFFASSNHSNQGGSILRVWNMWNGGLRARFKAPRNIRFLAFPPNDRRHIVIAYNAFNACGLICVFDIWTGQSISGPWGNHAEQILTLAFSPDGKTLISAAWDLQVRVWDVAHILGGTQLSFCNPGLGTHIENGWVKDVGGKLLFWVPKDHRARLIWPHSRLLGDIETTTELDLSRFKYGENWMECCSGEDSSGWVIV